MSVVFLFMLLLSQALFFLPHSFLFFFFLFFVSFLRYDDECERVDELLECVAVVVDEYDDVVAEYFIFFSFALLFQFLFP